ncbi:phosphoribosylglycinamide formyltransferase [Exophiala spinifera]|uniref:Phosphoribosylglycinamide formyltransferase n=1 Tax=Exophiala spinifera TaxID=91928 RepID=A0A0D2BG22_9EURO|nr:phosphoribosylglycinamide formyltransferase [Exophiala spinifera]KIW17530.1 phosphoribosylglycinamide formyltransferase [Exophiala spinifera]
MPSGKSVSTDKSRTYSASSSFNITVLISGSGTNLQALIDACGQAPPSKSRPTPKRLLPQAEITHVISNRREAYGLTRAQDARIPVTYHNLVEYKKRYPENVQAARNHYDSDLAQKILTHIPSPDLVVCAGWMHILSPIFINALAAARVPVINLHPALPGQFNGANAIGRAFEAFKNGDITKTGVMVHYVEADVDMGPPILVREVPCQTGDSQEDLEKRIHDTEWRLIVEATGKVLSDLEEKRKAES